MKSSKSIVITGSTRGIGFGMAREFLRRGHRVTVSGRGVESTRRAVDALGTEYGADRVLGRPCDVGVHGQVRALWDAAAERFGKVGVWINNAGQGRGDVDFWKLPEETIDAVVRTNLLGAMHGSKVAMEGMLRQGYGQIYNVEGYGSDGMIMPGLILYGATKRGLTYFTKGLVREAKGTPVQVGFLNPGIVLTELLTAADTERTRRILSILADRVETVTPYLVERILANDRHGARIAWLTRAKIARRFATAPFIKRDPSAESKT